MNTAVIRTVGWAADEAVEHLKLAGELLQAHLLGKHLIKPFADQRIHGTTRQQVGRLAVQPDPCKRVLLIVRWSTVDVVLNATFCYG